MGKSQSAKRKFETLHVCELPIDKINRTLGMHLDEGELIFSAVAQRHVFDKHPDDFEICVGQLREMILDPVYMGDDLRNRDNIEIIGRAQIEGGGVFMLIAVTIERDNDGRYRVVSCYRVNETKIQTRREKGFLKIVR